MYTTDLSADSIITVFSEHEKHLINLRIQLTGGSNLTK